MENHLKDEEDVNGRAPAARKDAQIGLRGLHDGIADMATLPLEDQAHLMFSTIAHATMECMGEATVLLLPPKEPYVPPQPGGLRPRSHQPRVRDERRYAELHHLARLSEAGSRLLEAYTRMKSNSRALTLHYAHRKRQDDGSVMETRLSYGTAAPAAALAALTGKEERTPPPPPERK